MERHGHVVADVTAFSNANQSALESFRTFAQHGPGNAPVSVLEWMKRYGSPPGALRFPGQRAIGGLTIHPGTASAER